MPEWLIKDSRQPEMVLHPSTQAALLALRKIRSLPDMGPELNVLDLGCGSGLLSIAAAGLWPDSGILASDISQQAVDDACHNMQQHGLEDRITVIRADAYDHPAIRARSPYDLAICNLLAELLIETSPSLWQHLKPGGMAVLSGILAWKHPQVVEAHIALGFEITGEIQMSEWRALIVRKSVAVS